MEGCEVEELSDDAEDLGLRDDDEDEEESDKDEAAIWKVSWFFLGMVEHR